MIFRRRSPLQYHHTIKHRASHRQIVVVCIILFGIPRALSPYSPRLQSLPSPFCLHTFASYSPQFSLIILFLCFFFFANELYVYEIRQTKEPIRDHERLVSCLSPAPSRLACEHDNSPRQLGVNERKMLCVHSATQG